MPRQTLQTPSFCQLHNNLIKAHNHFGRAISHDILIKLMGLEENFLRHYATDHAFRTLPILAELMQQMILWGTNLIDINPLWPVLLVRWISYWLADTVIQRSKCGPRLLGKRRPYFRSYCKDVTDRCIQNTPSHERLEKQCTEVLVQENWKLQRSYATHQTAWVKMIAMGAYVLLPLFTDTRAGLITSIDPKQLLNITSFIAMWFLMILVHQAAFKLAVATNPTRNYFTA